MNPARKGIALALWFTLAACSRESEGPPVPRTPTAAREAFARCLFDAPPARRDGAAFEAALRRAIRVAHLDFAVRAGRCERALDGVRASDPTSAEFTRLWSDLLPLVQATNPDDIAIEQSIRRVGNAWRAW